VTDKPKAPTLEPQHWRYIQARLMGATNAEAGESLGVDRATCYRWGEIPAVADELQALQRDATESALRHLKELYRKASRRLGVLLESENEAVALGAVREVLSRLPEPQEGPRLTEVAATNGDPWVRPQSE
jgi:hypothetical protein